MKKKEGILVVVILLLLVIGIGIFLFYNNSKSKNENNQPNHFGYSITTTGKSVMASIKSNEPKDEIVFKK